MKLDFELFQFQIYKYNDNIYYIILYYCTKNFEIIEYYFLA